MKKDFLKKVVHNFYSLTDKKGGGHVKLLLAVSGGADSMAMLSAFFELKIRLNIDIFVITVNHNIRPEQESSGDASFVLDFCKNKCPCILAEIPKNKVFEEAGIKKTGIEDAARFLRYKEFEKAAETLEADYILTAHNKNDYYETVLMRLFQGSEPEALMGILPKRGRFIRPLLNITRLEIEDYLKEKNIPWREDSTNFKTSYLRNNIRHNLVPALNLCFDGWQNGLDKTLEKIKFQNDFVFEAYKTKKEKWVLDKKENYCLCKFLFFISLEKVLKLKFLQEGIILLKGKRRIPYSVFDDLMKISAAKKIIFSGGFCIKKEGDNLLLFKTVYEEKKSELFYSIWIDKPCSFDTPAGNFKALQGEDGFFIVHENDDTCGIGPFKPPFCMRSRLFGDEIETSSGSKKSIKKIINEWDISYENRNILPIIEEGGVVKGIYGAAIGKKNWYVIGDV
ncbi:tRNA lysidine(34) synthetase TilS [Treponema putidum]|uniref:tRNA lysidine(34) synthetase TilS n=1 Tax=Treponema putidum TaxID=221027 RepID=UPI0004F5AEFF|nr:tRNA lysidine(34) synthetase TilS [Treponema putidum]AIN94859.1 tRNA(Ile)-lysidine synthetase [Treponema putidum]TWI77149.1 tRNA(Ile)-lysidine synthase [Treponema putidum]